jgi:hypothetical protein
VLGSDDYGQGMVDRIIVFKHKLEDLWAQEAERVDLGMSPGCLDARRSARF